MKIIAAIEPVPESNDGRQLQESRELSVEAGSHEDGVTRLRAQRPEGWRMLNFRRQSY